MGGWNSAAHDGPRMTECVAAPVSNAVNQSVAALLALLRAGEISAEQAFHRIGTRLTTTELAFATPELERLAAEERQHDNLLAAHAALLPAAAIADRHSRRFFLRLESRVPRLHLSRVAALDGAVTRLLAHALTPSVCQLLGAPLVSTLQRIRADEGRHVRIARQLALALGSAPQELAQVSGEVRQDFAALLGSREAAFTSLGIDTGALLAHICRGA